MLLITLKVAKIGNVGFRMESTSSNMQEPHAGDNLFKVDSKIVVSQIKNLLQLHCLQFKEIM